MNRLSAPAGVAFALAGLGTALVAWFPGQQLVRYALPVAYALAIVALARSPLTQTGHIPALQGVFGLALVAVVVEQPLLGYELPRQNFALLALLPLGVILYAASVLALALTVEQAAVRWTAVLAVVAVPARGVVPGIDWLALVGIAVVVFGGSLVLATIRLERENA